MEAPQIEAKITSGALSLTNLVLSQLENQSTRQAEKIVCGISPEMSARKKELHFNLIDDDSLREKLLRLKGYYAHAQPNLNLTDLLHRLCDEGLERIIKQKSPSAPGTKHKTTCAPVDAGGARPVDGDRPVVSQAEVRRQVWRRDRGQCSNCRSTFALEVDHVQPRAVGGPLTVENARLLCRACNQRAAIEYFGLVKMAGHLERSP